MDYGGLVAAQSQYLNTCWLNKNRAQRAKEQGLFELVPLYGKQFAPLAWAPISGINFHIWYILSYL
jgi:hypothetical protein